MTEEEKKNAILLIEAYFNGKEILVKDPQNGIKDWISIKDDRYWSYLVSHQPLKELACQIHLFKRIKRMGC